MAQRLEGRVAVITGAGSGIGLATAKRLASEGAKIVAVDMNAESGEAAAKATGGIFVKADVTSASDVENMYKVAFDTYGRIDIAFNNAGISPPDDDSILTTGLDAWERVLRVNTTSVFHCCKTKRCCDEVDHRIHRLIQEFTSQCNKVNHEKFYDLLDTCPNRIPKLVYIWKR